MKGDDGVINKGEHLDEDCGRVELLNDCLDGFLLRLVFTISQIFTNLSTGLLHGKNMKVEYLKIEIGFQNTSLG